MNIRSETVLDSEFIFENTKKRKAYLWIRLVNFLIDFLSCYILASCLGIILGAAGGDSILVEVGNRNSLFLDYIIFLSIYFFYYSSEYIFNGKTFGKFLTKTRALHRVNRDLDLNSFLLRCMWRLIPLNLVSFVPGIDEYWHDQYSGTIVVQD